MRMVHGLCLSLLCSNADDHAYYVHLANIQEPLMYCVQGVRRGASVSADLL